MENKVIEFPKKNSIRKRMQDKAMESKASQKAVLSLSIASVLVVSLFVNQYLIAPTNTALNATGNRAIASFDGSQGPDMKWEHDLARELSQKELQDTAKLAEKPTLRDDLVFGMLQGKYGMKLQGNRIESLEFIDAQAGEQPLAINQKNEFLINYQQAWGLNYTQVSLRSKNAQAETYSLIDANNQITGAAEFKLDDQGRVLAVTITK